MGSPTLKPRVAQLRRAPLLQRGGWGFESLTADGTSSATPSKLSLAEQPPCKRKAVGSIPTWGSSPPRSPTWQRHPAQTRTSRGSNPRGGTLGMGEPGFPHRPPLWADMAVDPVSLAACQAGLRRHGAYDLEGAIERGGRGPSAHRPSPHVWCGSRRTMRRRPMAGRPAVTRRMLVRPQPSQCFPRSSKRQDLRL